MDTDVFQVPTKTTLKYVAEMLRVKTKFLVGPEFKCIKWHQLPNMVLLLPKLPRTNSPFKGVNHLSTRKINNK